MKRTYKTAQGQLIDLDAIRLANEDAIAVGNMQVNARGDQLGPGGAVVKPRNQAMDEYYQIQAQADPIETMLHHQNQGVSIEEVSVPKKASGKRGKSKKAEVPNYEDDEQFTTVDAAADTATDTAVEEIAAVETTEVEQQAAPLRGNLADSVAKEAQVNQTLLKPLNKRNGIQRI